MKNIGIKLFKAVGAAILLLLSHVVSGAISILVELLDAIPVGVLLYLTYRAVILDPFSFLSLWLVFTSVTTVTFAVFKPLQYKKESE